MSDLQRQLCALIYSLFRIQDRVLERERRSEHLNAFSYYSVQRIHQYYRIEGGIHDTQRGVFKGAQDSVLEHNFVFQDYETPFIYSRLRLFSSAYQSPCLSD